MSRLIDADVLLEELKTWGGSVEALHEYIENMPTVCDDFIDHLFNLGYNQALYDVSRAMYHQCFECNNDEDMQKWDSGNWFRYKLFENVIDQLKAGEKK